ncbi:O-antigen ligase family protein [Desulfococcaceae bacterium HSG7]|nr:O-antigen ligase family protein [Desulfococcaceae bacterium HSG9]MDM8553598.1 O-antigen ligase family protein [Desulfococcaceae bacterium HSG7]
MNAAYVEAYNLTAVRSFFSGFARYLIYFLIIFTPLARGSEYQWAVIIIHFVTLLALTSVLVQKSLLWDWRSPQVVLNKPIAVLLIIVFGATGFSQIPHVSLWPAVLFGNYIVLFYLVIDSVIIRAHLRQLVYVIISVAVFLTIVGLLKVSGHNPFPWWNYAQSTLNIDLAAASSTFGNPNRFAGYMEMALPLTFGMFFTGYKGGKRFLIVYLFLIMLIVLIFTRSRGALISTMLSMTLVTVLYLRNYPKHRFKLIAAFIGGLFFISFIILFDKNVVEEFKTLKSVQSDTSLISRLTLWKNLAEMIRDYPVLGTGPGTFSTMFTQYQPAGFQVRFYRAHNDYLEFITEVGILLAGVYLWMIVLFFKRGLKKIRHPSRLVRGTTLGAMTGVTAMLIHSIADFNLQIPANAVLFTVLVAIVVARSPRSSASNL